MPNRILRESIWTSESLNAVSLLAEGFFLKLLPYADDFGRFDARPPVVKGRVLPLRDISVDEIEAWFCELERVGMIRFYVVRGVRYGVIPSWDRWNEKRAKLSRYPAPEDAPEPPAVQADASTCGHVHADANKCASIRDTGHGTREARHGKRESASPPAPPVASRGKFIPPTVPEVAAEVERRGITSVDPEAFVAFYESKGWRIGAAPMRKWEAALTTWAKRGDSSRGNGRRSSETGFDTPREVGTYYSNTPTVKGL